jgi:hypothetical protein
LAAWVRLRTPPDLDYAVPVSTFDDADLLYPHDFGGVNVNGRLYAGKSSALVGQDRTIFLKNIIGLNLSAEVGATTFRVGHVKTKLGTEGGGLAKFGQLRTGLCQYSAVPTYGALGGLANDLAIDGKAASFTGMGLSDDQGNCPSWHRSSS